MVGSFCTLFFDEIRGQTLAEILFPTRAGPIVRINPEELHIKDSGWFGTLYTGPSSVITVSLLNS